MHMQGLRNQHNAVSTQNEISEREEKDDCAGDEGDDRLDSSLGSQLHGVTCPAPLWGDKQGASRPGGRQNMKIPHSRRRL